MEGLGGGGIGGRATMNDLPLLTTDGRQTYGELPDSTTLFVQRGFKRTRPVLDQGPVGCIIMSLSALFFFPFLLEKKICQCYWCVNILNRKGTSHTTPMNKRRKDIQPKGHLNPAGPWFYMWLQWEALKRYRQLTFGHRPLIVIHDFT